MYLYICLFILLRPNDFGDVILKFIFVLLLDNVTSFSINEQTIECKVAISELLKTIFLINIGN